MSLKPRLHRMFTPKGRCVQVAMDHGVANVAAFLAGIEDMKTVVSTIVAARPDAILLSLGQAHWLQDMAEKPKPALVMRADPSNFYTVPTPKYVFCKLLDDAVEQAVALDAAAIVVNLFWAADQPDLYRQCVENISRLKPQCERLGMPLMVEPMLMAPDGQGGYKLNDDLQKTLALSRQAVELGADIVKADIAENISDYHLVVQAAAPAPLLPRGGARVPDQEVLERTYKLIQEGASGVVYGRNIYQHAHPQRMVRACQAIVHDGATVAQAAKFLENEG